MSGINTDGPAAGVHSFSRHGPVRPARVRGMPIARTQVAGNPGYFDPTEAMRRRVRMPDRQDVALQHAGRVERRGAD
jgi:hypothetical protein